MEIVELARTVIIGSLLALGCAVALIGAVGILRLPDVFARMHAAGMIDTLGAGAVLAALMIEAGLSMITIKLFLIVAFLLFTSPISTHALARAALIGGVRPLTVKPRHTSGEDVPSST